MVDDSDTLPPDPQFVKWQTAMSTLGKRAGSVTFHTLHDVIELLMIIIESEAPRYPIERIDYRKTWLKFLRKPLHVAKDEGIQLARHSDEFKGE